MIHGQIVEPLVPCQQDSFIHQLEAQGNRVNERTKTVGGNQSILTTDGFTLPPDLGKNGLAYLDMIKATNKKDTEIYPHVILTAPNKPWD